MKQIKCLAAALAAAVLLLLTAVAAGAQTPSPTVVRVGFPIQAGISEVDENGEYTGYLVDYLEQLCLFTGWEIEYVQAEGDINTQLTTLLGQLQNGEIDLMGTMNRSEALEEMFLYPNRSYGSSYSVLAVREDSPYAAEDFSGWDGIRVATYPRMINGMELLEEYARSHGFTYETIEYQTSEEMLEAVYSGEADAVVQVDISLPDGLRSIGQFAPNPYYLALAPQREDLLPDLNAGLEILSRTYVHLEQELYETYFLDSGAEFIPSEENPHEVKSVRAGESHPKQLMRMGLFTALAIAIHNFPEGLATFVSALQEPSVALPIVAAITIHNIPEGIAVSVPIYQATGSRRKAFLYSFSSGLAEPLGALIGWIVLRPFLNNLLYGILFGMVAGIMVFISVDELLPAAREYGEHHLSIYGLIAGMAVMAVSLLLFV